MVTTPRPPPDEPASDLQQIVALGDRLSGALDEKSLAEICTMAAPRLLGARVVCYLSDALRRCQGATPVWDDDTLVVLRSTAVQTVAVAGRVAHLEPGAIPPAIIEGLAAGEVALAAPLWVQRDLAGVLVAVVPGDGPRPRAMLAALAQLASSSLGALRLVMQVREQARELEAQLDRRTRDLKLLEQRLMTSDRLATIGMLAAGIGHEVANPLATVMLNNGALNNRLARAGLPAGALTEAQRLLAENDEALERIRGIVGELRTFARKDDESMQPLDLRAVIESSLRLCRAQLRGIEVKTELPMLPVVSGSGPRLTQVLLNLLVNAAQALGGVDKPRIAVIADVVGDEVRVTVADNGPGVPPDVRARIWDIFFTTKAPGEGTGLGLAIARDIVRRHGGRVELDETPGGGASFRLFLPRRAVTAAEEGARPRTPSSPAIKPARRKPSAPAIAVPAPGAPVARPRLLIVDDEVMILRALERELAADFEVITVASGDEALRVAGGARFDAVLCDLNLVNESGIDVCRRLAAMDSTTPGRTIFMSGAPLSSRLRAQLGQLPAQFVTKPFDMSALLKMLRELAG
jgi:signal transduction histidine kinase